MRARKLQLVGVVKDENAVALTEFAIVMPIVLLFFLAMLQYFAIVQASQLGNYAAYVAARVYAVRASIDANDAKDKAETAAAMVLAPIARPVPGEFGGPSYGSIFGGVLNTILGNKFGNFAAGYVMAKYVRLNSDLLGGGVTAKVEGTPKQVNVTINYPQPIYIPGLAELWNLVTGDRIYLSMKPLRQGLGGIPSIILPVYETLDQAQQLEQLIAQYDPGLAGSLSSFVSSIPVVMLPYINIQSKCSIGYSDWGSKDPDYRPRKPSTGNESDSSGTTTNSDVTGAQQKVEKTDQDRKTYESAVADAKAKCNSMCQAKQDLAAAHGRDDPVLNNPKASVADKAKAQADLNKYQAAYDAAASANATSQSNFESARQAVESDTGQSLNSMPCNCP